MGGTVDGLPFLREEALEPVHDAMWKLTVPKLLRPYFLYHRELLGKLCQVAWHTARQLMAEATAQEGGFRTGIVAVVQSAGDLLEPNPHVHATVPRGGWDAQGRWVPVP